MSRPLRVAELCAGYGGLTLGLAMAGISVELAWYAENDPDASAVMAAHHPGIPNLGDITTTDWTTAPSVDLLAAGFPCQPYSVAGKRKGTTDERWIWPDVAAAVRDLRPRIVLLENVPGLLVGGGLGAVLGDLAAMRYVGSWRCVRASDVGAAHQRERVFIVASPADADGEPVRLEHVRVGARRSTALAGDDRPTVGGVEALPTPTVRVADRGRWEGYQNGRPLSEVIHRLPTPTATDAKSSSGMNPAWGHSTTLTDAARSLLPTPRASDGTKGGPNQRGSSGDLMLPSAVATLVRPTADDLALFDVVNTDPWGIYGPAIRQWARILGRPAPAPTEVGARGGPVLGGRFVEWLMGLPAGYVTDHVGRAAALRILGNGVVVQQAAHAVRLLAGAA